MVAVLDDVTLIADFTLQPSSRGPSIHRESTMYGFERAIQSGGVVCAGCQWAKISARLTSKPSSTEERTVSSSVRVCSTSSTPSRTIRTDTIWLVGSMIQYSLTLGRANNSLF